MYRSLIDDVMNVHPGPWKQTYGYGDRGGRFTRINDANGDAVFDGEFGRLSGPVLSLLLYFPELVAELFPKPGAAP